MQDVWRQAQASPQGQAVTRELQRLQARLQPALTGAWEQLPPVSRSAAASLHGHIQQAWESSEHHFQQAVSALRPHFGEVLDATSSYWASSKVWKI